MAKAIEHLQAWFAGLTPAEKEDALTFLYGGGALIRRGLYMGPRPELVQKGLFVGPAPPASSNACPTCGKAY
jgi:hypothetical protein